MPQKYIIRIHKKTAASFSVQHINVLKKGLLVALSLNVTISFFMTIKYHSLTVSCFKIRIRFN